MMEEQGKRERERKEVSVGDAIIYIYILQDWSSNVKKQENQ